MMGYDLIADIAYQMEECFEKALQKQTQMTPVLFDVLFEALDTIEKDRVVKHNPLHILTGMQVVHHPATQAAYAI